MRESKIEAHLKARVEANGGLIRKLAYPGRKGAPDRMVVWGQHFDARQGGTWQPPDIDFIELKAPGKKPDDHQRREHDRLRALGCAVFVIDSIEAVDDYISRRK